MALDKPIKFDEGWSNIEKGITKLIRTLEGEPEPAFTSDDYMSLYTVIYNMSTQLPNLSPQLYDKYRQVIEDYTKQTVLPSLREKHDEDMLRELVKRWNNQKVVVKGLSGLFRYLSRYFIPQNKTPSLDEVALKCFHDLVYREIQSAAKEAIIALIYKEREGEQIDRALVKDVLDVYVMIGMGYMDNYEKDFESFMLQDTAAYYSRKASRWIQEDSCPDYMLKVEECLKREKERVTHYLQTSTEPKLLEKVQNELLVVVAKQLLENEHSGCCALLRDDKKDDLSRMYKLYHTIPQGLEHVAYLFKQHIIAQGNAHIKQADKEGKYMVYVTECFQNHNIFHKALDEAFEILIRKEGSDKLE